LKSDGTQPGYVGDHFPWFQPMHWEGSNLQQIRPADDLSDSSNYTANGHRNSGPYIDWSLIRRHQQRYERFSHILYKHEVTDLQTFCTLSPFSSE